MTEILTESFCERCGTRYTFESIAPRRRRLGGIRVLGRGLKNFVMSDDSSLDEAMAAARSDDERDATSQQLDAFHRTFNFCMTCRQYTCRDCWNATEARCLSCAPLHGAEPPAGHAALDHAIGGSPFALEMTRLQGTGAPVEPSMARVEPEMIGVAEATAHAGASAEEPDLPSPTHAEPEVEAHVRAAAEPAAASAEVGVTGLEPGTSLDEAIAAYEASLAEASVDEAYAAETPVAEPSASTGPGVDVIEQPTWDTRLPLEAKPAAATTEPEPAAATAESEAEPAAGAAVVPEPPSEAEPVAAPEVVPPVPAPAPVTEAPGAAPATPQWPTGPRWPTAMPARPPVAAPQPEVQPLAAVLARQATEAMWAASSRDLVQPVAAPQAAAVGVQPCVNCGISLSATARFCRRCGTSQLG